MLRRRENRCGDLGSQVFQAAVVVSLIFGASGICSAQENIGGAKVVVNNVQGGLPTGRDVPVIQGDDVFLNEAVISGPDSKARLLLKDNSDVTIGPGSTLKLDNFVYSGPKQAGTIAINLAKGTLRFATGDASKRAYTIWTPTAAIGVRGTILRIKVTPTETTVINEEGTAVVCHRAKNDHATVEELRQKRKCDKLPAHDKFTSKEATGYCGCAWLNVPNQQATVSSTQVAVTEAPIGAISEPILAEGIGGLGFGVAPAFAAVVGVAVTAGAIEVSESTKPSPLTP